MSVLDKFLDAIRLNDDFDDIMNAVHETNQPIFLTKENKVDMVVLSMEAFENLQF